MYRCVVWYAGSGKEIADRFGYDLEVSAYEPAPTRRLGSMTVRVCFLAAGVSFASAARDIAFYFRALQRGDADHPSLYVDKAANLVIDEWASVEFVGQPSRWLLWAGAPAERGDLSVAEIVREHPHGAYVAYLYRPDQARRRAARRCLEMRG
jgi:hypothetical protein